MPKKIAIMLAACLLLAACGSSGPSTKNVAKGYSQALQFSKCMRAHGVPNFPDPRSNGGGIQLSISANSGINPRSPAFQAAQTSCQNLMPGGGPPSAHPSAQARTQLSRISQCMRQHGITDFPDPTSSPPSSGGDRAVMASPGGTLAIPNSINVNSPAFKQAAAACNFGRPGSNGTTKAGP